MRVVSRIVLIPAIAGVSYEFLRFAGRHDSALVNILPPRHVDAGTDYHGAGRLHDRGGHRGGGIGV